MGLNINAGVSYIISRHRSYKELKGKRCLMLGVQEMDVDGIETFNHLKAYNYELEQETITNDLLFRKFDSRIFFKLLGFDVVEAMDVSDYEGAELIFDLNEELPKEYADRYDYIFDGGTLEHIFNVPQALRNIGKMLKEGGVIIHDVPTENWCDHGFYSFSPCLFLEYYLSNMYRIEEVYIFNYSMGYSEREIQYKSIDCRGDDPANFLRKKLDLKNERANVICVAMKQKESKGCGIPIQGLFQSIFNGSNWYKLPISNTVAYITRRYRDVAIYGNGEIAYKLHKELLIKGIDADLIMGDCGEMIRNGYRMMDLETAIEKKECIVIGSFSYADIIEKRIMGCGLNGDAEIVNMLDIK